MTPLDFPLAQKFVLPCFPISCLAFSRTIHSSKASTAPLHWTILSTTSAARKEACAQNAGIFTFFHYNTFVALLRLNLILLIPFLALPFDFFFGFGAINNDSNFSPVLLDVGTPNLVILTALLPPLESSLALNKGRIVREDSTPFTCSPLRR